MLADALGALMPKRRSPAMGRLVAVLCAIAILVGGFAHGINHLGAPNVTVTAQVDSGGANDAPELPKQIPVAVDHCLGCLIFAAPAMVETAELRRLAVKVAVRRADEVRPHLSAVELPPPISMI